MGLKIIITFKKKIRNIWVTWIIYQFFFLSIFATDEAVDGDVDNNDEGHEGQNPDQRHGQGVPPLVSDHLHGDAPVGLGSLEWPVGGDRTGDQYFGGFVIRWQEIDDWGLMKCVELQERSTDGVGVRGTGDPDDGVGCPTQGTRTALVRVRVEVFVDRTFGDIVFGHCQIYRT